jgi:hypothetical protein
VALLHIKLLFGGRDSQDMVGSRRQVFNYFFSGAAQQYRLEFSPQFIKVFVTEQFAFLIHYPVPVEKPESRAYPPVINEFHH